MGEPEPGPRPFFPFRLSDNARLWAEYTGTLDRLLATAQEESAQLYGEMIAPDLPPDHPDQLSVRDLWFHSFELDGTEDEYICLPEEDGDGAFLRVDLCRREWSGGVSLPVPESGPGKPSTG